MVKQLRQNLIAQGRDKLCNEVSEITGAKALGLFTDIDVQLGEQVFVFTTDRDIQYGTR
ncbi:MAG: Na-translocating system protein MpsC family protein [Nitrospira sp.]